MSDLLQRAAERVQDSMDEILANFKADAKITVLVRTPGKPTADFCLTSDTLDEVAAMIERRKAETPPPQTNVAGLEAQLDAVWNAAVEKAAVIANDCVHLTPDPGSAIRAMLDGRYKLHQPTTPSPQTKGEAD